MGIRKSDSASAEAIATEPLIPEVGKFYERPWGGWKLVDTDPYVKILTVAPGGMLSLQKHEKRAEEWTPLTTGLIAYQYIQGDGLLFWPRHEAKLLEVGEHYTVSAGNLHRLINPTEYPIKLIETFPGGGYDENDITRIQDIYER